LSREHWAAADFVSVAAHKLRGPKGIGALVVKPGCELVPVLRGGDQERGLRPGTQDASLAAGFRVAAERAIDGPSRYERLAVLRDRAEQALVLVGARHGVTVERNGIARRAPHVSNMSWGPWRGPELCAALDLEGVAVSSGSACSAGTAEPSSVIRAMLGSARAQSAVRISLGEETTWAELERAVAAFDAVLNAWRASNPLQPSIP
jgi:cysteine desulfurase